MPGIEVVKDLNRYIHNLTLKKFFHIKQNKPIPDCVDPFLPIPSPSSFEYDGDIIDALESLAEEDGSLSPFTQYLATSPPIAHSSFRPKSIFYPAQSKGPYLKSFYRVVYADIRKLFQSSSTVPSSQYNLSASETKVLDSLIHMADIIIKSADKGGGIVLQDRVDYIIEAHRLLSDRATYKKLKKDPNSDFAHEVDILVKSAFDKGVMNKIEASFFNKDFYEIPYFYHLPKIHKNLTSPPG